MIGPRLEDAAVEIVAGRLRLHAGMAEHVPVIVERGQRGGGDFVPAEPLRIHQEGLGARNAQRDVVKRIDVPAEMMRNAKRRREFDAQLALGVAHLAIECHGADARHGHAFVHGGLPCVLSPLGRIDFGQHSAIELQRAKAQAA